MNEWVDDEISRVSSEEESRILDQHMIRAPIHTLNPGEPISVPKGSPVSKAVELMKTHRVGCVLVTDGERLAGILTERDLLLKAASQQDFTQVNVETMMTPDPEVLSPDNAIVFALNKMSVGGFRHVPLVDGENRPVGVVSMRLIVEYIVDFFPGEVLNLPPEPGKDVGSKREGA